MTLITQCAHCGEKLEAEFFDKEKWKLQESIDEPVLTEEFECDSCGKITMIDIYASGYKIENGHY